MFVPHRMNADDGFLVTLNEFLIRRVHLKLDVVIDGQVLREVFEVLNAVKIFLMSARSDEDEMDSIPKLFVVHQQRSQLVHALEDQRMVLFRSVLSNRQYEDFSFAVGDVLKHFEIFHLARRVNDVSFELRIPNRQNVILRPRAVYHHSVSASSDDTVESRKESVVVELDHRQKWISCDVACVVVSERSIGDATQHVGADGGIVCVRGDFALANVLKDWVSERVA